MTYKQNRVKQAVYHLNNLYYQNKIVYPRVDNSYFGENNNYFPHPDLNEENRYCLPLNKTDYPVNRDTILLYLGHKGLISASNIVSMNNFISTVFDENLKPLNQKYIGNILDKFLTFYDNENLSKQKFQKGKLSDYSIKYIYSVRLKPTPVTLSSADEKIAKKNSKDYKTIKKSINSEVFIDDYKCSIDNSEDFFQFLDKFRLKRKFLKLREKYAC